MSGCAPARQRTSTGLRAAVLDVDGTVATCPYDFEAMRAAVRRVALAWHVDTASLGVRGIIEQIAAAAARVGAEGSRLREAAERAVVQLELEGARQARLLPGAAEALAAIGRAGLAVGLITRNCRAASELVLRDLSGFDSLLTRDDVPRAKPHPDHVLRSLASLGVEPHEAAVVGDHTYDMEAGRGAGARLCVGVLTGGTSMEALTRAGAHLVLGSLADLPAWLAAPDRRLR